MAGGVTKTDIKQIINESMDERIPLIIRQAIDERVPQLVDGIVAKRIDAALDELAGLMSRQTDIIESSIGRSYKLYLKHDRQIQELAHQTKTRLI